MRQFLEFLSRMLQSYPWTAAGFLLVQFFLFLRWLHRRVTNDELLRIFVEDIATNHLPRIYGLLEKLCDQQGIERSPLPHIRWVDLRGRPQ